MPADDPSSIRAVAASLLQDRTPPTAPTPNEQGPQGADQNAYAPEGEEEEDQTPDTSGTEDGSHQGDESGGDGEDGGGDEPYYRVKVAGEDREVSLSDLLKSYTGEGAIAKRLQEATEARNELTRARDIAVEQERAAAKEVIERETTTLRTQAQQLAAVYQHYSEALLAPQVQMPDPSLQRTDPLGYLTAMEAFRQDQQRLQAQQVHMQEVVQQAEQMEAQSRVKFAQEEVQRMVQEVPAMADPVYRKAQAERVFEIGRAVGFSDEEVRKYATDRRVIYLAMLAAQGAETIMRTRTGGKPTVTPKAAPPRSTGLPREVNGTFKKKNAAVIEQARSTGDYRDVAKTLIVSSKPTRR
jgi:hypothetical protein